jgi:PAS domain S-box-containing protein
VNSKDNLIEQRSVEKTGIQQTAELVLAKARLENEKRLLTAVLEALPVGVAITDTNGGTIQTNAVYERIWGGPRPEPRFIEDYVAYKAWWDATGEPVAPEEWASAIAIRKGEVTVGQVMRLQRFDGSEIFVINSASPVYDNQGNIAGSAVAIQDITDLKRTGQALQERERDFAHAQEVGNIGSWRLDIRRNVLTWSDETYHIFGIPTGAPLSYETFLSTVHPDDRAYVQTSWQEAICGKPYDIEHRIVVDGRIKWVREKAYLEFDTDGKLAGGFGIAQDIDERKQVEEALRRSEERHRVLAQTMLQGVIHYDADGRIIEMNQAAEHILGKNLKQFSSSSSVEAEHPTIRENGKPFPDLEHPSMVALRTGQTVRNEIMGVFNPRLGVYRWISIDAVPVFSRGATLPSEVYSVFEDITERRQVETALREKERTLRALIDAANESIWLFAIDGEILAANETAARRLGMTVEEVIGKKWQSLVSADLVSSRSERSNEILRTGRPICFEDYRDGIFFDHSAYPVRDENGAITAFAMFSRDITARKSSEEALRTSEDQLRVLNSELEQRVEQRTRELQESQKQYLHAEKLSAIGKLSASIAHEFNNPLQGILSVLKGLKKRAILEEEDSELLDGAIEEGDRIKDLISSLQEFNRPTADRKNLMDIHKALDSILLLYKSDFRRKRITVMRDYAERLPLIHAVSDQIKQVFLNMLINAVDACRQGGGVIAVSTRQEDENTVAVAIKDNGVGIQPADMERIFQPFYTTKPEVKGTGLGLSVSYGIVQNHQGEIRVESHPGEGSTFTVLLPIKDAEVAS